MCRRLDVELWQLRLDERRTLHNHNTAHCLSPIAACIWRHCNGDRDITELAELTGASESLVADTLHELREKDLLDAEPAPMQDTVLGESRRETSVRVARYGATAAGASMIVSATAATPAMASSGEALECCQCYENSNEVCACGMASTAFECMKQCEKSHVKEGD